VDALDQDWEEDFADLLENWSVIEKVLPAGWLEAAQRIGAWRCRPHGIDDPRASCCAFCSSTWRTVVPYEKPRSGRVQGIWPRYRMWPC